MASDATARTSDAGAVRLHAIRTPRWGRRAATTDGVTSPWGRTRSSPAPLSRSVPSDAASSVTGPSGASRRKPVGLRSPSSSGPASSSRPATTTGGRPRTSWLGGGAVRSPVRRTSGGTARAGSADAAGVSTTTRPGSAGGAYAGSVLVVATTRPRCPGAQGSEVAGHLAQHGLHRHRSLGAHRGHGPARGEQAGVEIDDRRPLRARQHERGPVGLEQPPAEEPGPAGWGEHGDGPTQREDVRDDEGHGRPASGCARHGRADPAHDDVVVGEVGDQHPTRRRRGGGAPAARPAGAGTAGGRSGRSRTTRCRRGSCREVDGRHVEQTARGEAVPRPARHDPRRGRSRGPGPTCAPRKYVGAGSPGRVPGRPASRRPRPRRAAAGRRSVVRDGTRRARTAGRGTP